MSEVILENKITAVSSTSEDSNWPDDFVLNDSPKRAWKADGTDTATLTCSTSGAVDTIAIFGTNADSVIINISDPNEVDFGNVTLGNVTYEDATADVTSEIAAQSGSNSLWGSFDEIVSPVNFAITFAAATGVVPQAGVVVIGKATQIRSPNFGMGESGIDYSIYTQMANGSFSAKHRDRVRTFDLSNLCERDTEFYTIMRDLWFEYGQTPMAWKVTDLDSFKWVAYARLQGPPQGRHSLPRHSSTDFSLIEVI